ncbi:hypothetical protein [Nocardioides sp.]|uniref:Acg family FMN-binding oxidoreductase n=1 Tax=Nocardioides sp. TaxID=35761 RepID=UPI0035122CF3
MTTSSARDVARGETPSAAPVDLSPDRRRAALEDLVLLACRAPSIHNTQPWAWQVSSTSVTLFADTSRGLPAEDPDGRGLLISCGAALQHLTWAARCRGWLTHVRPAPGPASFAMLPAGASEGLHEVARIELDGPWPLGPLESAERADDLALLLHRCTDRRRFTGWPVPTERLAPVAAAARSRGVAVASIVGTSDRFRLEALLHRVDDVLSLDAARLAEQRAWVDRSEVDGVPLGVLPARTALADRFGPGTLDDRSSALGSGEGLLLLGTEDDAPAGWLRTGQALGALWLEATRAGLSVVPVSQVIEVAAVREEIEQRLAGGAFRPHLLLRVGWQSIGRSDLPRTPRRPLADVLVR